VLRAVGNGLFATRGIVPECDADDVRYLGTYIASVFNRPAGEHAGRMIENESMVNAPNRLPLTFRAEDGPWFHIDDVEVITSNQVFELRTGLLVGSACRDACGRETSLTQRRLARMHTPNFEALDAVHADDRITTLRARTVQSRIEIVKAMRVEAFIDDELRTFVRHTFEDEGGRWTGCDFTLEVAQGTLVRVEKTVMIYTSRDPTISEPGRAAVEAVRRARPLATLAEDHATAWDELWECAMIGLGGHPHAEMVLNVHTFHVLQTISPNSIGRDVGVPARGLHGEVHRGRIFWDELFIFPYLSYRFPNLVRSLRMYRYRRLEIARERSWTGWCDVPVAVRQ